MPKVLVVGEKLFAIHSFTEKELNILEISETRNDSVAKIGKAFDSSETEPVIDLVKGSIMMFLKQSKTYKLKTEDNKNVDGYILGVFKGKAINGRKNYIASWLGKMPEEAISQNPQALIPELLKGFKQYLNLKDYHKKSAIHNLLK